MKLISLKKHNEEIKELNFNELLKPRGKVVSIRVVSAYFDIESIRQLFEYMRSNGHSRADKEFIIIVDAYSSRCQSDETIRHRLNDLNAQVLEVCKVKNSGIYLAKAGPLFHSKGYLASSIKYGTFSIGSLNLTQKGIHHNEELIVRADYRKGSRNKSCLLASQFYKYVDDLIEDKAPRSKVIRVDQADFKGTVLPSSLREMFLSGRLYYEHKEQDPFRFDLRLPDAIKQSTSNISDLLENTTSSSIDIAKLVTRIGIELPSIRQGKSMWKKFCVETCYGFWSPSCYYKRKGEDCLCDQLEKKMKNRSKYYEELYQSVFECDKMAYNELKKLINEIIHKAKEEGYKSIDDWDFVNEEKLQVAWEGWQKNLKRKMEDEHFKKRLYSGVADVVTPDIWEDNQATIEFEISFFESILYYLRKTSNVTVNWPAYAIGENIHDVDGVIDPKELRDKVKLAFEKGSLEQLFEWS